MTEPIRRIQVTFGEPEFLIIMQLAMLGAAVVSEDGEAQFNTFNIAKQSWDTMDDKEWNELARRLERGAKEAFPVITHLNRVVNRD